MKRPMIGIMPLVDTERDSLWMLPGYMDGLMQEGAIPVMLPLTTDKAMLAQIAESYDGFLFSGGQDVSPERYGEEKLDCCGETNKHRDEMEARLFSRVYELDKPILGICRGIQFINASLGGTLYQDLETQYPSGIEHHQKPPYDVPVHGVEIEEASPLYGILNTKKLMVNSYHHQAIKKISPHLLPMAYAEDQIIEGVYAPDKKFVWGVQWHPEFSFQKDENSRKILGAFVKACLSEKVC